MALQTDLNVSPYYDDYNPKKDFYRVLFQPGVAVQARELNQLQSILQNQIEKFGDNIFKRGTIIEGCNITRHEILPYVKIKDLETDGTPVSVSTYENLFVKNSANVQAYIVKTSEGFESRNPDLKTLYVTYNGSGTDSNTSTFGYGDSLQVFDTKYPIFKAKVLDGSSKFANTDSVVIMSSIAVVNSTGGSTFATNAFVKDQHIQNGVANAIIVEANTTANTSALILRIKPLPEDLLTANTIKWRFGAGDTIRNVTTANVGKVAASVGTGAEGSLVTDSFGKITSITVTAPGSGYYVPPHITVKIDTVSSIGEAEINQLDVSALNYLTTITVGNSAVSAIGTGYGVTVDEGTIYQKGFFSRVSSQLLVVNKYSNTNFTKSVGFLTTESIINSSIDTSLLDNATGTYNYTAPGADRLKLTPELYVLDKQDADSNTEFLPIIEFADGRPYKQSLSTVYNIIGDEMAKRTYDESGNYVLDQFLVTTRDAATFSENSSVFKLLIDPGKAYVKGYRIETVDNYQANVARGVDTRSNSAAALRLGYGNFIRVNELGGLFQFNTGASIDLYDTVAQYISTNAGSAISPVGTKIGAARIRSVVNEYTYAEPGSKEASYRLYLFDIVMNSGKNFSSTKSVYYGGTNKGIADVVLNSAGVAELQDVRDSSLLFKTVDAMKSVDNITYTYRTINESESANSAGSIVLNLGTNEYFPYSGTLSSTERRELLVIPLKDYQGQTNATGGVTTSSSSNTVTGTGGMNFITSFNVGDYIKIANTTSSVIKQIAQITAACTMILTTTAGTTYSAANANMYYPKNVPISLTNDVDKTAIVSSGNTKVMTIYLGSAIANSTGSAATADVAVAYNAVRTGVSSTAKTSKRQIHTRVRVANNVGSVHGPWALGVADAYRLRNVYIANGASRDTTFNVSTNITGSGTSSAFITVSNNPFSNGDSLVYSNTSGTGVLGGLTNGSTYYVVYGNTSGFALSSTRGGANLTLYSNTSSTHKFTGSPLFFTPNTYGVTDVTNDFYIDMNQKEDYLDTSYLNRKPRPTLLNTNDVLLIKYDAFDHNAGVKTVSSYPINDGETFAQLAVSANVHTMEIPEFTGDTGVYYDLRDQFDFRPKSSNTIAFVTDISTVAAGSNNVSIVNPTEPTDSARFAGSEQYFPAPDTTLNANIVFYLGRTDRVVIDSNHNFTVRGGKPGFINDTPTEPKDSITLQILRVPAYPSLPQALSSDMIKIVDTKVVGEGYGKRRETYSISAKMNSVDRNVVQVKNYRMSDIAGLEKRIKDLEYYVSFTLAEAIAKARFIPASADALLDRFRYGFFVDPFTDYNYADLGNPEFWSTIRDNQLGPKLTEINLEFQEDTGITGILTLPYTEFTVINQADATDGGIVVADAAANTSGTVTTTTVTQSTATILQSQRSTSRDDNGSVYEEFYYTMSSLVGPVQFFICSRDNYIGIEVFQSSSGYGPWTTTTTSASASQITNADISSYGLTGLNNAEGWELNGGVLDRKGSGPVGGWVEDQFKMNWTHDPIYGQYYRIRVYKGGHHGGFFGGQGRSGTFQFKMFYPTDAVTTNTITVTNTNKFQYTGMVKGVYPPEFSLSATYNYLNSYWSWGAGSFSTYIADAQKFEISVTGLKPNTYHRFLFNNQDKTSVCSQKATHAANPSGLLSDGNGVITFDFFYDAGITAATTDFEQQNKLAAAAAGIKTFAIQSYDGTSTATGTINMKYYSLISDQLVTSSPGLNITPSVTSVSTSTGAMGGVLSGSPTLSQAVNDAIDLNNITKVNFDYSLNLSIP